MITKEIAKKIKDYIEGVFEKYGCCARVSANYQDEKGKVRLMTESWEAKPASVSVRKGGKAEVSIHWESLKDESFFDNLLDDIEQCLRGMGLTVKKVEFFGYYCIMYLRYVYEL